jgi:hypothetical protein
VDGISWQQHRSQTCDTRNASIPTIPINVSSSFCSPLAPQNGITYYRRLAEYRKPCQYRGECRTWVILTFYTSSECFATSSVIILALLSFPSFHSCLPPCATGPPNSDTILVGLYLDSSCTQGWHFWEGDTRQSCFDVVAPPAPHVVNGTGTPLALTNFQCRVDGISWQQHRSQTCDTRNASIPTIPINVSSSFCSPLAPQNGITYYRRLAEYRLPCNYTGGSLCMLGFLLLVLIPLLTLNPSSSPFTCSSCQFRYCARGRVHGLFLHPRLDILAGRYHPGLL